MIKESYNTIDFVVMWVDCNDPVWQTKKKSYDDGIGESSTERYRDWSNLRFWFRSVEKYAPWVNKIHFVTDGQIPKWLNINNPKIHIVNHKDFIPLECLPLFNSSAIEIGAHLIPDLAEQFVLFNDDMFLTAPITKEYFYVNSVPCDTPAFLRKKLEKDGRVFNSIRWNNYDVINKHFNKYKVVFSHFWKFFNIKYGLRINIYNALNLCRFSTQFDGIIDLHVSIPYLKSEWKNVWEHEEVSLSKVRQTKFRSRYDLTQWLIRYWRICEGNFIPKTFTGKYFGINNKTDLDVDCEAIIQKQYTEICINDEWIGEGYETARDRIIDAFLSVFPEKCSFEI